MTDLKLYTRVAFIGIGLAVSLQSGGQRWPRWNDLSAQICVERPGDNGSLNIRPADILISDGPTLTLLGEQASCAYVRPGRYTLWAQSRDPYDPGSTNETAWKSISVSLSVGANEVSRFEVCRAGAEYNWKVQRPGPRCQ